MGNNDAWQKISKFTHNFGLEGKNAKTIIGCTFLKLYTLLFQIRTFLAKNMNFKFSTKKRKVAYLAYNFMHKNEKYNVLAVEPERTPKRRVTRTEANS